MSSSLAPEEPVLLTALAELVDNLVERDQQTRDALGDIRATLDAVLKHVAASPSATAPELSYTEIVSLTRQAAAECIPADALAAFVSKGDDALLRHEHIRACHFPQGHDGQYAGHHPADSAACLAYLDAARADGAAFFVIPKPSFWWLDHYAEFAGHLRAHCRLIAEQRALCAVWSLTLSP